MSYEQFDDTKLLSQEEKEYSINYILNEFEKQKLKKSLLTPFKELPMSVILNSTFLVKILSFLAVIIYFSIMSNLNHVFNITEREIMINFIIMFFSPILFFINLIDITRSFSHNVYELETTLKYKFHQIIGYKFVLLTLLSLIINFILILSFPFIHLIDASITVLSSLFISTSFIYYVVFKFRKPIIPSILIIFWSFINFSLVIYIYQNNLSYLYDHYKTMVYIIGVGLALILHMIQFKYIFKEKYGGRVKYAKSN